MGADACKSERYTLHSDMSTSCGACHSQFDPIGFGLERYDLNGRYRTHDDGRPECNIEGVGELPGYGEFSGPAELAAMLVDNGELEDCAVRQLWEFGNGRAPGSGDEAEIREMVSRFSSSDRSLRSFLVDWISSDRFALRAEER